MLIHNLNVYGTEVDDQTRCVHYNSDVDIIAVKFKCCKKWFPCFKCHSENTDHPPQVWSISENEEIAVLCGSCGHQLKISEYLECTAVCPKCDNKFNPGCARHYDLYFEVAEN